MSPRPNIESLVDADPRSRYVRRVLERCVTTDVDTGDIVLIPQKAFVFDPDLSIHQSEIIEEQESSVELEYAMPPNGAVRVPVDKLIENGAHLKATPHDEEPVLGPAHHSVFGASLTPSKTDKAAMRDILMRHIEWLRMPELDAAN